MRYNDFQTYVEHLDEPRNRVVACTYQFMEPVQMTIRKPDGTEVIMGYGIGELIETYKPSLRLLVYTNQLLKEIPLTDGSMIIEYPADMKLQQVFSE